MIAREPWYPAIHEDLHAHLSAEGLSLMGVCDAESGDPATRSEYRSWLEAGHHGSMKYLERHEALKYEPASLLPGAASIVFVGLNYYQKAPKPWTGGKIARYAWGRDYHKELGKRIKRTARRLSEAYPDDRFRAWTDATPLSERYYGERAGIGFTGRNTLLISAQYGSWFVVGEILSTRAFPASGAADGKHGACPTNCRKCIDVCPTGALYAPHRIDASRCISYLTIEHDGSIPVELREKMGAWIFGCDLCQEVCPLNVRAHVTDADGFRTPIAGSHQDLARILDIQDDAEFTRLFAGSPLMRAKRSKLVRNACIAAANTGARRLLPRLEKLSSDSDPVVAEHARWARDTLRGTDQLA